MTHVATNCLHEVETRGTCVVVDAKFGHGKVWLEGSDLELRGYKLRTTTTPRFLSICWAGGRDFHWLVRSDEENEIIRIYIYILYICIICR